MTYIVRIRRIFKIDSFFFGKRKKFYSRIIKEKYLRVSFIFLLIVFKNKQTLNEKNCALVLLLEKIIHNVLRIIKFLLIKISLSYIIIIFNRVQRRFPIIQFFFPPHLIPYPEHQ